MTRLNLLIYCVNPFRELVTVRQISRAVRSWKAVHRRKFFGSDTQQNRVHVKFKPGQILLCRKRSERVSISTPSEHQGTSQWKHTRIWKNYVCLSAKSLCKKEATAEWNTQSRTRFSKILILFIALRVPTPAKKTKREPGRTRCCLRPTLRQVRFGKVSMSVNFLRDHSLPKLIFS